MKKEMKKLTLSAMFLALGLILPYFTGQIQQIGNMLLPMHIPVLFCGLICGKYYGALIGLLLPFLRHVLTGMPLVQSAITMTFELMAYGFIIGLLYEKGKKGKLSYLYFALIVSMIAGRLVWGLAQMLVLGLNGNSFTVQMFLTSSFFNAIPGIILQLLLIPFTMHILEKRGMLENL